MWEFVGKSNSLELLTQADLDWGAWWRASRALRTPADISPEVDPIFETTIEHF
jgi:hypothetical protein